MTTKPINILYRGQKHEFHKVKGNQCYLCYREINTCNLWLTKNCTVLHSKCSEAKITHLKRYIQMGHH